MQSLYEVEGATQRPYNALRHLIHGIYTRSNGQSRIMGFYFAYCDESGHEKNLTENLLIVAGLIINVDDPEEFENAFRKIEPRGFHAAKHLKVRKNYPNRPLNRSRKISDVIGKYALKTFSVTLDMAGYREIDERYALSEWIGYPKSVCARIARAQVNDWQRANQVGTQVDMVFEEGGFGATDITQIFHRDGLPLPIFKPKHSIAALDAADYLAWREHEKRLRPDNYERFKESFGGIYESLNDAYFVTPKDAAEICEKSKAIGRERLGDSVVAFHTTPNELRERFR